MSTEQPKPIVIDLTGGHDAIINQIISTGYFGSLHSVLLGTSQGMLVDGELRSQTAIVARLRFDNAMAITLRDMLNGAIAAASPASDPHEVN